MVIRKILIFLTFCILSTSLKAQPGHYINLANGIVFGDDCELDPSASWGQPLSQGWNYFTGGDHNPDNQDQTCTVRRVAAGFEGAPTPRRGSYSYRMKITKDPSYPPCCNYLRAELGFLGGGQAVTNWEWASLSIYVPNDFCFGYERMLVAYDVKLISGEGPPTFGLNIQNGRWVAGFRNYAGTELKKDLGPVITGQWEDWTYYCNHLDNNNGLLILYRNQQEVWRISGIPVYYYEGGSTSRDPYVQQGLYKWVWASPNGQDEGYPDCNGTHIVYYDEYKFGNSNATLQTMAPDGTNLPPVGDNSAPQVSAGGDQTITLPVNFVTLNGYAFDLEDNIVTYNWSKVSGNLNGTITNPTELNTNVTGLTEGTYVFKLTVTDDEGLSNSDNVTITVNAVYDPSSFFNVKTGTLTESSTGIWYNSTTANSSGINTIRSITGNGGVQMRVGDTTNNIYQQAYLALDNDNSVQTIYAFAGDYPDDLISIAVRENKIFVGDYIDSANSYTTTDTTVNPGDLIRIYRTSSTFKAQKSIDTGTTWIDVYTYTWSTASDLWVKATFDTTSTMYDPAFTEEVTDNILPTANAGADKTIATNNTSVNGLSSTDSDGTIASYYWTKISGLGGTITYPNSAITTITGLSVGTYIFRLTVTDNDGGESYDDIQITLNSYSVKVETQVNVYLKRTGKLVQTVNKPNTYITQPPSFRDTKLIEIFNTYTDSLQNRRITRIKSTFSH